MNFTPGKREGLVPSPCTNPAKSEMSRDSDDFDLTEL
jgi:hypothetical protein